VLPACRILGLPAWYLLPPRDTASSSDAILVLAGAEDGQHQLGAELVEAGVASDFIISTPSGEEETIGHSHCVGEKRPKSATETWCIKPMPGTRMREAKMVGSLARNEN